MLVVQLRATLVTSVVSIEPVNDCTAAPAAPRQPWRPSRKKRCRDAPPRSASAGNRGGPWADSPQVQVSVRSQDPLLAGTSDNVDAEGPDHGEHMNLKSLAVACVDISGVAWLMRPFYQGRGAILSLHRVLPAHEPVRHEPGNVIRVEQLREALQYLRRGGWEFASLNEIPARLQRNSRRFVAVTLDDGYADNLVYGLPLFREFNMPFTVFPVTGFLNRTQVYWPLLIPALLDSERIVLQHAERGTLEFACETEQEKLAVIPRIWSSRWPQADLERSVIDACERRGRDVEKILDRAFLSWDQLRTLAQDPLASVGVHSISHRVLARLSDTEAEQELSGARAELESKLGVPVRHVAYPYGSPGTCGEREFRMAQQLGFATGYTTTRGNLHPRHASTPWSLPRHTLSMVPHAANVRYLRISLFGVWDSPLNSTFVTR